MAAIDQEQAVYSASSTPTNSQHGTVPRRSSRRHSATPPPRSSATQSTRHSTPALANEGAYTWSPACQLEALLEMSWRRCRSAQAAWPQPSWAYRFN